LGFGGHIVTHTMHKSFVRLYVEHIGLPFAVLLSAIGRSSKEQVHDYVGMLPKDHARQYEK
jgi:hypothetical protein